MRSQKIVKALKPHISLNVVNIEESVEFYKRLFDIEPVKYIKGNAAAQSLVQKEPNEKSKDGRAGYAKFDVRNPPINFVLNEVPFLSGGTLSHLGIQVNSTEDVLKTRRRWIAEGLQTVDEMNVDCCYALQDKTWTRDPDGNEWEVFVVLENTEPAVEACERGGIAKHNELSASVCCNGDKFPTNISRSQSNCC